MRGLPFMMNSDADTIAAIATPPGEGGIAVVRISGPQAGAVAKALFRPIKGARAPRFKSHRIYRGRVADPLSGETLDGVLLLYFAEGRSYTGDETVEISCHGGPFVARRILEAALGAGARPAGPGEFTRRAFAAGRIDLSRAEAVADIIAASSDRELLNARRQLDGELGDRVDELSSRLDAAIAEIESRIDFPDEEEIGALPVDMLEKTLGRVKDELESLSATYREGRTLREGYRVAIVGRPNVGKSSLLNRLLGADRAIVTAEPGTTRDIIEERVLLGGVSFVLTDTAGIRAADPGSAEDMGAKRAMAEMEDRATDPGGGMLLVVLDASMPLADEDHHVLGRAREAPHIVVFNKSDLCAAIHRGDLPPPFSKEKCVAISALKGHGMRELIEALGERRTRGGTSPKSDGYLLASARHKAAVDKSIEAIDRTLQALRRQPLEIVALEARLAREALDDITGKYLPENMLDIIFSRFCVGK